LVYPIDVEYMLIESNTKILTLNPLHGFLCVEYYHIKKDRKVS